MSKQRFLKMKDLGAWEPGLCIYCRGPLPAGCNRHRRWCSADCVHAYKLRSHSGYLRVHVHRRDHGICADCGLDTDLLARVVDRLNELDAADRQQLWRDASDEALRQVWGDRPALLQEVTRYLDSPPAGYVRVLPGVQHEWDAYRLAQRQIIVDKKAALAGQPGHHMESGKQLLVELDQNQKGGYWEADHTVPVCEGGGASKDTDPLANMRTLCRACHLKASKALAGRRAEQRRAAKQLNPK